MRTIRTSLAAATLALGASCDGADTGRPDRPGIPARHVFLVTVAGLRADHCSAYQYFRDTTLFEVDAGQREMGMALSIDDLAAEGTLFMNAFSPAESTDAALASLFTGRSPLATGVLADGDALADDERTIAEALAEIGFEAAAFVTRSGPERPPLAGLDQGFDHFVVSAADLGTIAASVGWVDQHDFGNLRPVFLWLHLEGPLPPYGVKGPDPVDFASLFTDPGYAGPADGSQAFRDSAPDLTGADRDHVVALYDGDLAQTNYYLWYLLDYFRYSKVVEDAVADTVFVVAGTTGQELFRDGRTWGTTTLHDSTLRVPLFLRHTDSLTGRRIFDEVVELANVAPTLAEWFGAELDVEPHSLLRLVDSYVKREFEERPACAVSADGSAFTVRDGEWRLILEADGTSLLFHTARDPGETEDVAARHPDVVRELRQRLDDWRAKR